MSSNLQFAPTSEPGWPSDKDVAIMFIPLPWRLCFAFVRSSVRRRTKKNCRGILMKYFGRVECATSNKRLDFRGDPDHDVNPGIFKGIFTTLAEVCDLRVLLVHIRFILIQLFSMIQFAQRFSFLVIFFFFFWVVR